MKFEGQIYFIIFILFLLSAGSIQSQEIDNPYIDSLNKILKTDSISNNQEQRLIILNEIANQHYIKGDFREAHSKYNEVVSDSTNGIFEREIAKALSGLSHIEWRWGDNVSAINKAIKSIEIFKAINDTANICKASDILGGIYASLGKYGEAEKTYRQILKLTGATNDSVNEGSALEHIGIVKFFEGNYDSSILYYQKSYDIFNTINAPIRAAIAKSNIGEAYLYKGNYSKAIEYLEEAITEMEKESFRSGLIFANYSLGSSKTKLGQYKEGLKHYEKALELIKITGEFREKPFVLELMSENLDQQGDHARALELYKLSAEIKDSIDNIENRAAIEEIRTRYEVAEKERKNKILSDQNKQKEASIKVKNQMLLAQFLLVYC
ncbi:tetratricopeptide repeat protein [Mangrovivirga cuniculi]|uniref:Uncharacterized protein n=1 Tax=Mangrovivirga cuniculi TaxID=2715131 RepID=A0A4D7JRK9_9BACT|nr:tetratricopeptide repeat protein [Mangrovivirga cuniculi]QCK14426.1 hypothetical protein DCC35_06570 [Mangrovivirga cuniculi]